MNTPTEKSKYAVLYVDDEEQALKYFRKALDREYTIFTAPNAKEAWAHLEKNPGAFGVVISDQKMPGEQGVQMLGRIRQKWPNIVRILVTAYSEFNVAVESVNSGAIYKYLHKPVDFPQLKETLKSAMEMFLAQVERDTLVRERLSTLQRMVVADRVKSLAAMAGGLSHHLRNSMTAMSCFLEEAGTAKSSATPAGAAVAPAQAAGEIAAPAANAIAGGDEYLNELWTIANTERERLLKIVQSVGEGVVEPKMKSAGEEDLSVLIAKAVQAATPEMGGIAINVEAPAGLAKIRGDAEKLAQMLKYLVTHAARLGGGRAVKIIATGGIPLWNTTGVRIAVTTDGAEWLDRDVAAMFTPFALVSKNPADLGLEMLGAFFIAYQHGGDILVHKAAPGGPGFEVLLPLNPDEVRRPAVKEDLLEMAFARIAS
jgi:two-component system probable response regulator PhcQ